MAALLWAMSDPVPQSSPPREPSADPLLGKLATLVTAVGMAFFAGVFWLADALPMLWRFLLAALVAGPFLLLPTLLRDRSGPPPGFKARKWEDEDERG